MLGLAFAVLNVSPCKTLRSVMLIENNGTNYDYFLRLVMDCSFC